MKIINLKKLSLMAMVCAMAMTSLNAQQKELTLNDLIPGGKTYSRFVPQSLRQLQWCGDYYLYVSGDTIHATIPGKASKSITVDMLNAALKLKGEDAYKQLPRFMVTDTKRNVITLNCRGRYYDYNLDNGKIERDYAYNKKGSRFELDLNKHHVAYTVGQNVWVDVDGDSLQVTNETQDGIVCGTDVHQREFGITKGLFWAPDGEHLAFYRMDESMVPEYPIVTITTRVAEVRPVHYPMAGMKSHHVTLGIYDLKTKKVTYMKTGLPKEKFLTNIAWSPDSKYVYIEEVNRQQDTCYTVRYDIATGKGNRVLMFTDKHYVEPQTPIAFVPNNSELFVRQSCQDGYNHLYLYNIRGIMVRQLTKGNWMVTDVLGFADNGKSIIFQATASDEKATSVDGLERHIWKVDIATGKLTRLTKGYGVHSAQLSGDGRYFIDNFSGPETPRSLDIYDTKSGKLVKHLLTAKDTYTGYPLPDVRIGKLLADDGKTELNYRIVTPPDMDPTKKYPTVIYVYGGPHAQMITANWMYGMRVWDIYMALRGYIVFTLDNRGSANRGHEFESVIHRNLGKNEMADQMTGVRYLQSLPYVDSERIGVHGWSFGGFMTTNLMLTYPDVFKVGVAGGPVIDWERYEIMYGERYMDTPDENPEGYNNANLCLRAGDLKGRLMIIHGTVDPVVVWQHSQLFLKACVEAGTMPDYFVYPEHEHNVIGKDRPHLHEIITRYFDDFLK
ncbi:MAG: S9 family peptidase [Paludibacteraceae bacterium]|nr:S9 family peptidase [Paludibacteraceae bacterium]